MTEQDFKIRFHARGIHRVYADVIQSGRFQRRRERQPIVKEFRRMELERRSDSGFRYRDLYGRRLEYASDRAFPRLETGDVFYEEPRRI